MSVQLLGAGYAAIGVALAAVLAATRGLSAVDALCVVGMWPMYVPFVVLGGAPRAADASEAALADALAAAAASPLAGALPAPEAARALAGALREATRRCGELDALLARPDMAPDALAAEARALAARGATAAAAAAQHRTAALRQLAALRGRYRAALDEVAELTRQLAAQVTLVRVSPELAPASVDLVCDLVARIDALAELGEPGPGLDLATEDARKLPTL